MIYCADWLRSFIPEVPIEFIPTMEPFWTPTIRLKSKVFLDSPITQRGQTIFCIPTSCFSKFACNRK